MGKEVDKVINFLNGDLTEAKKILEIKIKIIEEVESHIIFKTSLKVLLLKNKLKK